MNFSSNDKISNNQLRVIISASLLGSLSVSLPLGIIEISKGAAYISILFGGIFTSLLYYFAAKAFQKADIKSYEEEILKNCGKLVGKIILVIVFIHTLMFASFQLSVSSDMINSLTDKNISFLTALFFIILISGLMAQKGSECIGRTSEIAFVLMLFSIIFIFLMAVRSVDFDILIPVPTERKGILKGALDTVLLFGFVGYTLLLMPKSNNGKKYHKSVLTAFLTVTVVLSMTTALAVSSFGVKESQRKIWPVIQMMNYIEFPSSLVERQEVLMSGFYIFSIFILTGTGIYILSSLLESIFGTEKKKIYIFASSVILFISAYGMNIFDFRILNILKVFNIFIYFLMLFLPVKMLIRRKRK